MARLRDCASVEMSSTRRLNTPGGGPSIDSNARVGPTGAAVVSEAFDVFDVVQPDASISSAATAPHATPRASARPGFSSTTLAPPCGMVRKVLLFPSPAKELGSAKRRQRPAHDPEKWASVFGKDRA